MPSLFTLEGPNLGYAQALPVTKPAGALGATDSAGGFLKGVIGLFLVGMVGRWAYRNYKRTGRVLGGDMLSTIAAESRSRADFARRAEAWNAGNAHKLSDLELARRFGKGHHQATVQLIRAARRERERSRGALWNKLAKGLKGTPPTGARERKRQLKALENERESLFRAMGYAGNTREQVDRYHVMIREIEQKMRALR